MVIQNQAAAPSIELVTSAEYACLDPRHGGKPKEAAQVNWFEAYAYAALVSGELRESYDSDDCASWRREPQKDTAACTQYSRQRLTDNRTFGLSPR